MASIDNSFLAEQIDLLNNILAGSTDHIYVFDRSGRYLYASPAGLTALGLQTNDLLGKTWRELNFPSHVMRRYEAEQSSVFQTGTPVKGEMIFPTGQGNRHYEYVISPIFGREGEIDAVTTNSRDITDRKQAEKASQKLNEELEIRVAARTLELAVSNTALQQEISERQKAEQTVKESEMRFQALVDAMFEGIVVQENGRIIEANAGFATMFGYSLEEVTGKSAIDFLTPESLELVLQNTQNQYELPYEVTGVKKDGTFINLEVVGKQSRYQGRTVRVSAARDITERKRVEAALNEKQSQIQRQLAEIETIYQSAPIGLGFLDTDLRFVRINQRLAEMNGLPVEAHLGRTVREVLPELADTAEQILRPILATGEQLLNVEIIGETPAQPGVERIWVESFLPLKEGDRVIGINTVCEEVTERRRTQQTLAKELLRTQTLFETSFDGIVILNEQGNVLDANPRFAEMLGYTPEETARLTVFEWEAKFSCEELQRFMQHCKSDRRGVFETQHRRKDGSTYDVEISYNVSNWEDESIYFCACRDISDRKLSEAALQKSEEQLRLALEFAQIGSWDWDITTNQIDWNQNHFHLLGLDPQTATASYQSWRDRVHPDDVGQIEAAIQHALQTHTTFAAEYRVIHPDGSLHWVIGKGRALYDAAEQPTRMVGVILDITDRRRAEAALRERERLLSTLTDALPVTVFRFDTNSNCIYINDYWTVMAGRTVESVMGLGWVETLHPEDRDRLASEWLEWSQNAQERGLYQNEGRLVHLNGESVFYYIQALAEVDANSETIGYVGVMTDITDRKQAEQKLQERETILRLFAQYAPAGIAMFDQEMRYVMTSQRWADDYHLGSLELLIGRSHYDVFPEIPERWKQIHQRCLAGAIEKCEEDLFIRADGKHQWIRWEVRPWHTATGEIGGIIVFSEDITERKEAEASILQLNQELQQKVSELQTLLDVIPIGIGIANDPECQDIRVNPAFAEVLNIPTTVNASLSAPEAERPTTFKVYQNGRELSPEELPLQYAATHGVEVRELEVDVVWQDGTVVTLLEYAAPLFDEHGKTRGSVGAFLNITERKRAEADLQKYKDIFQFSEHGLETSKKTTLDLVNPAFARMHGYTVEEMNNKPILDLFPTEYHAETLARLQQADQIGYLSWESYHIRKDGSVFPILLEITVINDEQGKFLYRIVSVFDTTERKRDEAALRDSEERYRVLVQNFPNGAVCLFDHDLRYVIAEGRELAEIGLSSSYLEGKTIWEAFDAETCRQLESDYRAALAGHSFMTEVPYSDRIYSSHLLPLLDDQGVVKLAMSVTQNVTLQRQADLALRASRDELDRQVQERTKELRQMTDELQRSNQELEQFAYIASHDLQEPLRAVTSFTQMLAKRYRGHIDAKADTYIEFIVDGATRMQQLIRDLLAYSRTGRYEMKLQPVDCHAMVERVKKDLQVTIAEAQAVITVDPLPTVTADPTQLGNLFQNLISNSLKYRSEASPQIHISAQKSLLQSRSDAAAKPSSLSDMRDREEWVFSVQDNGIGIDPQYAERIFGIFQRLHTSDEYSGTGLGLAICKKIVERHDGRIWVDSHAGQGATFFFTIPTLIRTDNDISPETT